MKRQQSRGSWQAPRCVVFAALALAAACAIGCGPARPRALSPAVGPVVRCVADRVLADFRDPPPFNWGEGVLMAGMLRAGAALDEPKYEQFVRAWADRWEGELDAVLEGTPDGPGHMYCGVWGPAAPVLRLYERTKDRRYLAMAEKVAAFIETRATRTASGALAHWGGNQQLWVDTLYMVCPVMANLTRVTGRGEYLDEAVRQLDLFAARLQDPATDVFWHMYDESTGQIVGVRWGRGNGWVAMSYVEVLRELDRRSPAYARRAAEFRRLMDGLLLLQDGETHLWHTALDHPETYTETSAAAMFLASLVDAQRLGLYSPKDRDVIPRTWTALAGRVDADGHVIGVSGGTGPTPLEHYASKVQGAFTWGTGAFLLAGGTLLER